jgi:mono/diheme cytochrome c family protein
MKQIGVFVAACLAVASIAGADEKANLKAAGAGRVLFVQHCASCHGMDGKGGGPVATGLKDAVPDLTALPLKNGKFDADRVRTSIDGTQTAAAHGTRDMPVWGKVFAKTGPRRGEGAAQTEVWALVEYVRTLQAQPGQ